MKHGQFVLGVLLLASVLGNVLQYQENSRLKNQVPYRLADQDIAERAIRMYVAETGVDRASALGPRFPVVTRTREQRCVNLMLPRGAIGWMPIYCFDWEGRLILKDRI